MSTFIITPTNVDYLESILKDPITGRWTIPVLTYNPRIINPYFGEIDPLNEDPRYHDKVINYFYTKLTEKWLFKEPIFRKLLKYFKVEKTADQGTVSLVKSLDKLSETTPDEISRKYILKYIEKYFITERFVRKILKEYVAVSHIKWYDLFNNTDTLKELFVHKLKKLITETIYELQDSK
jgi:hypothetical protein